MIANDSISDSLTVDLKTFPKDSTYNDRKYSLSIESQQVRGDSLRKTIAPKTILSPFKPISLVLSRPVDSIDQNKRLLIINDSTSKKDIPAFTLDLKTKRRITIDFPQIEKTSYTLVIPDSIFRDIFGWWNRKITYKWNSDANENYGNIILKLKFDHPEKYYVIKLLNQDNITVETFYYVGNEERTITIKNIRVGMYHLQANRRHKQKW